MSFLTSEILTVVANELKYNTKYAESWLSLDKVFTFSSNLQLNWLNSWVSVKIIFIFIHNEFSNSWEPSLRLSLGTTIDSFLVWSLLLSKEDIVLRETFRTGFNLILLNEPLDWCRDWASQESGINFWLLFYYIWNKKHFLWACALCILILGVKC